ncbi:MAG: DUF1614 domain-containing protein [Candidatus Binatia bacterium]
MRTFYFFPLTLIFILLFFLLLIFLFFFVQVGLISYTYERLGVSANAIFPLLLVSLIGSAINLPLTQVRGGNVLIQQEIEFFGMRYVVPVVEHRDYTLIAINVGGAIVPTLLSLYLLFTTGLFLRGIVGIAVVAFVAHALARPVAGIGIAIPFLVAPLVAACVGLLLAPQQAPALAYMSGTMGCLIGADLLNLRRIGELGAPIVSIGGAGTFDGIFLTGIVAVLLT